MKWASRVLGASRGRAPACLGTRGLCPLLWVGRPAAAWQMLGSRLAFSFFFWRCTFRFPSTTSRSRSLPCPARRGETGGAQVPGEACAGSHLAADHQHSRHHGPPLSPLPSPTGTIRYTAASMGMGVPSCQGVSGHDPVSKFQASCSGTFRSHRASQ